jgi:amidase
MTMEDLSGYDAIGLAALVRRKDVTPLELVERAIRAIERIDPHLNAVVTRPWDRARAEASTPLPEGPFTGVPFLMKDLLAPEAGVRLTSGSAGRTPRSSAFFRRPSRGLTVGRGTRGT